jgi:hypothetical protein
VTGGTLSLLLLLPVLLVVKVLVLSAGVVVKRLASIVLGVAPRAFVMALLEAGF